MARDDKRITVYPDPTAAAIVGGCNAPSINLAVEALAGMISRAEVPLERSEWNYLADVLNGCILDGNWNTSHLALEVSDAHRLNGTGEKWFEAAGDKSVKRLIAKIESWDPIQLWSVLLACRWFWEQVGVDRPEIDHRTDEWWTLRYRIGREMPQEA